MARKMDKAVVSELRDDLLVTVTPMVTDDPDTDRAWTMEQVLSSYKRARKRLLEYREARKEQK